MHSAKSCMVHTRMHAHEEKEERARVHRQCSSILGPLAMPRDEQFLKGPRVHRITPFFPLFLRRFDSNRSRFVSLRSVYLSNACCTDTSEAANKRPFNRTFFHSASRCNADNIFALIRCLLSFPLSDENTTDTVRCVSRADYPDNFSVNPHRAPFLSFLRESNYDVRYDQWRKVMWFKYYKGYYDVRKLELELVSRSSRSSRLEFRWNCHVADFLSFT